MNFWDWPRYEGEIYVSLTHFDTLYGNILIDKLGLSLMIREGTMYLQFSHVDRVI